MKQVYCLYRVSTVQQLREDGKIRIADKRLQTHLKFRNLRIFRGSSLQQVRKKADICFATLDIDQDSGSLILHPSLKPEPVRHSVDKGPESDPLHNSGLCYEIPLCIIHNHRRLCF